MIILWNILVIIALYGLGKNVEMFRWHFGEIHRVKNDKECLNTLRYWYYRQAFIITTSREKSVGNFLPVHI